MPTVKKGWELPPPPAEGAVPTYFIDNGVFLGWHDAVTGEPSGDAETHDIEWPFVDEVATISDFKPLGFIDLEDIPAE